MNIRQATLADIPALNLLVNGAYRGDESKQGWTTEADLLDGIRTTEPQLAEIINKPGTFILLAEEDNDIKGCVYLEKQEDALYLGMLSVQPALQGKGLGAQLMTAGENKARELGCGKIKMSVITARDTLIAYYERKGFQDTGERIPFPNDPKFGIPKQPLEFMVMEKEIK